MSAQPWQHAGATVYQLTDDGTQNLWSAHVNGPKSSHDDDCRTAQKMAAAPDMYEALKDLLDDVCDREDVDSPSCNPGRQSAVKWARAALAKAGGQ